MQYGTFDYVFSTYMCSPTARTLGGKGVPPFEILILYYYNFLHFELM